MQGKQAINSKDNNERVLNLFWTCSFWFEPVQHRFM